MLTESERAAIRARCEAATKGPWELEQFAPYGWAIRPPKAIWGRKFSRCICSFDGQEYIHDMPFILHARSDLPRTLDDIDVLRGLVKELLPLAKFLGNRVAALPDIGPAEARELITRAEEALR